MFVRGPASDGRIHGGLGVGLSVVRRLVELHGGTVRASSDGETGSEFVVDLPLDVTRPEAAPADAARVPAGTPSRRVLIIDDNTDACEALALLLTSEGHVVETRADGIQGLGAAATFRPDTVLLDIGLPGTDGYEVAQKLRESEVTRNTMLIAVTGYGQPADRLRTAEAGFDHHLTKPVDLEVLMRLLAERGKPATDQ